MENVILQSQNYFDAHFNFNATNSFIKNLQTHLQIPKKNTININEFSEYNCTINWRMTKEEDLIKFNDAVGHPKYGVQAKLCQNYRKLILKCGNAEIAGLSNALFQIIGRYMDLLFVTNNDFYTELLCMHTLNHIMKTRKLVINNKNKLETFKKENLTEEKIESCRDQGLARLKVLILCPFRKHAYEIVATLIKLIFANEDRPFVSNLSKFKNEFSDEENYVHPKRNVAEDYKKLMSGNIDDCFNVGISLAKKCLKLYTKFEESDILLCSPVGLRLIIGDDENDTKRNSDFLSSIEILIIDKAHILLMQNWEHLFRIFETINLIPSKISTDISRIRHWSLNNFSRYYRQTLIFSNINFVELHGLMSKFCENYAGEVSIILNPKSLVPNINVPILQGFYRLDCKDPLKDADNRFIFFTKNILPKCESHTLIFVSSYFDFVRLRNYLKKEHEDFSQIHEYAKKGKIAKARNMFFTGQRKLLILTERFYFYFRYHIKGIKNIVFYQLPINPLFYIELINFAKPLKDDVVEDFKIKTKIIFSSLDVLRLQNIFGKSVTNKLIKCDKSYYAMIGN